MYIHFTEIYNHLIFLKNTWNAFFVWSELIVLKIVQYENLVKSLDTLY